MTDRPYTGAAWGQKPIPSRDPHPYTGAAWGQKPPEPRAVNPVGRPTAARRLAIEERRQQVALLVLSHVSYRKIGELIGVSLGTVADDVKQVKIGWAAAAARTYGEFVTEEVAKLDALERAWMPKAMPLHPLATAEDVSAAAAAALVIHRLGERRAKLLGLNQPTRHEVGGIGGGPVKHEMAVEAKRARGLELVREIEGVHDVERTAIDVSSTVVEEEAG